MTTALHGSEVELAPNVFLPATGVNRLQLEVKAHELSFLPILTLVVWMGCLGVGVLGVTLHYGRPQIAAQPPPAIQAQLLNVELGAEPVSLPIIETRWPDAAQPPPLTDAMVPPPAPPWLALAEPASAPLFALPVDGPAQGVASEPANHVAPPATTAPVTSPSLQTITHGSGEGKQPAPIYPSRALREHQEGTVRVRLRVGENGRVISAEAFTPSLWPLLNQEAVRVVRERWRFAAGPGRLYEVAIRFELQK